MQSGGEADGDLVERLRRWLAFARTVLPGGSWWNFDEDVEIRFLAEPVTVSRALLRMWNLVANDRWIIFAAFSTLIVAAVSFEAKQAGFFCAKSYRFVLPKFSFLVSFLWLSSRRFRYRIS